MEIYKKTIVNVMNLLFDKVVNANEEMEELVKFETSLAQIMCKSMGRHTHTPFSFYIKKKQ
jgi:hypothetical protein